LPSGMGHVAPEILWPALACRLCGSMSSKLEYENIACNIIGSPFKGQECIEVEWLHIVDDMKQIVLTSEKQSESCIHSISCAQDSFLKQHCPILISEKYES